MTKGTTSSGFTMIETLIYLALFTIIMTGLIASAFMVIQNADKTSAKVGAGEEINFVLKKFDWVLTGADSSTLSISGGKLSFENPSLSGDEISIERDGAFLVLGVDGGADKITTESAKVEDLNFFFDADQKIVTIDIQINGISARLTKYLRI
jgi:hypothetical protein